MSWRNVVGVLVFAALAVGTLLLIESNSPDARLGLALDEIYDEYGFEPVDSKLIEFEVRGDTTFTLMRAPMLEDAEFDAIYERISDEFASSLRTTSSFLYFDDSKGSTSKFDDVHQRIREVDIVQNVEVVSTERGSVPSSAIIVMERETPSYIERLKNLWPW